ncbi:unnamed protein product, partial [Polarella glacialis]
GEELVLTLSPPLFRKLFESLKLLFHVSDNLSMYFLRRGGGAWNFVSPGSMEKTLLRGRWSTSSTARIYLQDAVAAMSKLKLNLKQKAMIAYFSKFLQKLDAYAGL